MTMDQQQHYPKKLGAAVVGMGLFALLGVAHLSLSTNTTTTTALRSRHLQATDLTAFTNTLPASTRTALNDATSPQSDALTWLSNHPDYNTLPDWQRTQLFAMASIHYALDGPNWVREPLWGPPVRNWLNYSHPECFWDSVWGNVCNSDGELVTLNLDHIQSSGGVGVPPEIGLLSELMQVSYHVDTPLSIDELLPAETFSLSKLESISLSSWGGSIPTQIGTVGNTLKRLNIYHNAFMDAATPTYGTIPTQLGACTHLLDLTLHQTGFTGVLPTELGNLAQLTRMTLTGTRVNGAVPSQLGRLARLTQLALTDNRNLAGTQLPSELGLLSELNEVKIQNTAIPGSIPSELMALTEVRVMDLANNQFNGELPSQIGMATDLRRLSVQGNALSGPIPSQIGLLQTSARSTLQLELQENQFDSALPTELGLLTQLEHFNASSNSITGLGSELGLLDNIKSFDLSRNVLTGDLTNEVFQMGATGGRGGAWALDLSRNALTGVLDGAVVAGATRLVNLNLADNRLQGQIPTEFGLLSGMDQLRLGTNGFLSTIPTELGLMDELTYLDLSNLPALTGPIPSQMASMTSLVDLDLSGSGLTGAIPTELSNLVLMYDLQFMDVTGNSDLSGAVPEGLCELRTNQTYCVTRDCFDFDCGNVCGCGACFCSDVIVERSGPEPFDRL